MRHISIPGRPVFRLVPGEDVLVEKRKQSLAEGLVGIEVLQPDQEGRDVIPGFGIQPRSPAASDFGGW